MNFFQRAWRKQRATNRARNIRRYRKGHPKLGCYKCWYDCYEIEGDHCPECNALIDRDAPWWRDGRWSRKRLSTIAVVMAAVSIAGTIWLQALQSSDAMTTGRVVMESMATAMGLTPILGIPLGLLVAGYHSRNGKNGMCRIVAILFPLLVSMLIGIIVV